MRRVSIALLLVAACAAQDPFERVLQLARTRQKMAQVLNHLPDYTCVATTERVAQGLKDRGLHRVDTLRYEVAHFGKKELWGWPGATKFQDTPLTSMVQNGTIGTGDFALHARTVFVDGNANVKFVGEEELEGRHTLRWDFTVPVFASGWNIEATGRSAVAGSSGSFWADANTLDVVRLEIRTEDLPFDFPVTKADQTIDYAQIRMGSANILLPQTALLSMELANGERRNNLTEFSHCRRYSGEAEIKFEAAATEAKVPEARNIAEVSLPAGLRVRMKLKTSIDSATAMVGDRVEATISGDVINHSAVLVPKGALLTGRIRRMERRDDGELYFIVGIELDDIEFPGHHARFFGSFNSLDSESREFQAFMGSTVTMTANDKLHDGMTIGSRVGSAHLADVPGVGTFFMKGSSFRLPEGTAMSWETK
jgi:hypothetical protein